MRSQRGLTLIELLATIVILSIIGITIWNVFFQGYKFSKNAVSKNSMIQEANIVITNLKRLHQKYGQYYINNSTCDITVKDSTTSQIIQTFHNPTLCYTTNPISGNIIATTSTYPLSVTVSDRNNMQNFVKIDTVLYRLLGGGN